MKVVFLSDDFPPISFGGAGISTYELAKGVQKAGHDVSVITTCCKREEVGKGEYDGLPIYRIYSDYHERWRAWVSLYNPPVVRQVGRLLSSLRPDVVHANNIHFHLSYYCLKAAKRYAKTVVWTARDAMAFSYGKLATDGYLKDFDGRLSWRDHLRQAGKRYNPFRNVFIRKYLASVDARFAVSDALKHALLVNGVRDVEVLHTGIRARDWDSSSASVEHFKMQHRLNGKKIVLFGGRLGAGASVTRAMALLQQKVPEAVLLVMGREEDAKRLLATDTKLNVVLTGWLTGKQKATAYAASDVAWVPSTYFDAFPRSALEAAAAGKPVIAGRFGGASELVIDGKTGYIVNPFHPEKIADKTADLFTHPEKAVALGKAGRARAENKFDLDTKIKELLFRYQSLANKNSQGLSRRLFPKE